MKSYTRFIAVYLLTAFIFMRAASQDVKWAVRAGGTGYDQNYSIVVDKNKYVYTGVENTNTTSTSFNGQCTITGGSGSWDATFSKLDSNANCSASSYFVKNFVEIRCMAVDSNSNIYLTGYFWGTKTFCSSLASAGNYDIFIAKYNSSGTCLWANKAGGTGNDYGLRINVDNTGNVYVAGLIAGTASFGGGISLVASGSSDGFIAKYNSSGTIQWAKKFGGPKNSASWDSDGGFGISNIINGIFYVSGQFDSTATWGSYSLTSHNGPGMFVAKMDDSGNFWWVKSAVSNTTNINYGSCVIQDNWNNVFVTGDADSASSFGTINSSRKGQFVARYDSSGQVHWITMMGRQNAPTSSEPHVAIYDSSLYFAGNIGLTTTIGQYSVSSNGGDDILIAKLDYAGKPLWVKGYGGTGTEQGLGLACDKAGVAYVSGPFTSTTAFGSTNLSPSGTGDAYILKVAPTLPISSVAGGLNKVCKGTSFTVKFKTNATYTGGNVFTAQLSDTAGNFSSPVAIGTLTATTADSIVCTIPDSILSHTKYRIRIVASNPSATGEEYSRDINVAAEPPVVPSSQAVCSDTPYIFAFENLTAGSGGDAVEWAYNNSFTNSYTASSPATIFDTVSSGATDTLWIRSKVSATGCVSTAVFTILHVITPPASLTPYATDTMVCSGSSTAINIPNSEAGVRYELRIDTIVVNSGYGNDTTLVLNTGALTADTTFEVWAIDTFTGCNKELGPIVTITIAPILGPVEFIPTDTILCVGDNNCYSITAENNNSIFYTISGNASLDSSTGCVSSVTGDFIIKAIATSILGCTVDSVTKSIIVPVIYPPTLQDSISICSDTVYTFYFINITAGGEGNQIEWAADSSFSYSNTISSPANFSIAINPEEDSIIWIRSLDSVSGCVSTAISITLKVKRSPQEKDYYVTDNMVCSGAITTIKILDSQLGISYIRALDSTIISSELGNGDTISLNSEPLVSTTDINIIAIDTLSGCSIEFSGPTVAVSVPLFVEGDTLLCIGDTSRYTVTVPDSGQVYYDVFSGGAEIDTITGHVSNITSSFVVVAVVSSPRCSVTTAYRTVNVPVIGTPVIPTVQNACSDSPVTFVFDKLLVNGGNEVIWAIDSNFTYPQFIASDSLNFLIVPGEDTTVWLISMDSTSGCISDTVIISAIVYPLPDSFTIYIQDTVVCSGASTIIEIPNSELGVNYTLFSDSAITNGIGNGDTLYLSTSAIYQETTFYVLATDTISGCSILLNPTFTVTTASVVASPYFIFGDTAVCFADTSCYTASASNSISIIYSTSGGADIDSITGCISNITSNFTVIATAVGILECSYMVDSIHVEIDTIKSPLIPSPQMDIIDSIVIVTFNNIYAGCGGNQIEWSTDSVFSSSQIETAPANISFEIDTAVIDTLIWIRTRDSLTGSYSVAKKAKASPRTVYAHQLFISKQGAPHSDNAETTIQVSIGYTLDIGGFVCVTADHQENQWGIVQPYYTCETAEVGKWGEIPPPYPGAPQLYGLFITNGSNISIIDIANMEFHLEFYDASNSSLIGTITYPDDLSIYPFKFQSHDPTGVDAPYINLPDGLYYILLKCDFDNLITSERETNWPLACPCYLKVLTAPEMNFTISNPDCDNELCFNTTFTNDELYNQLYGDGLIGDGGPLYLFKASTGEVVDAALLCESGDCNNQFCKEFASGNYTASLWASQLYPVAPIALDEDNIGLGDIECSYQLSFAINAPLSVSINPTSIEVCQGDHDQTAIKANTSGGNPPYQYQWSSTSGIVAGNHAQAIIKHDQIQSGTYYVTATDAYGCEEVTSFTVVAYQCCQGSPRYLTLNDESVSHLYMTSPYHLIVNNGDGTYSLNQIYKNNPVAINNHFKVDLPLIIQNFSNISLGENTAIEITDGNTLVLDKSSIFACSKMWQGIKTTSSGYINGGISEYDFDGASFISLNSNISHAVTALECSYGSYYHILSTKFTDNLTGILINGSSNPFAGTIERSTFQGVNPGLPLPYNAEHAKIGIYVTNNSYVKIGYDNAAANIFQNLRLGILALASNVDVKPNYFRNMFTPVNSDYFWDGTGILGLNLFVSRPHNFIYVYGFGSSLEDPKDNSIVNFSNMRNGVYLWGVNTKVIGNRFRNIGTGPLNPITMGPGGSVTVTSGNSLAAEISKNLMEYSTIGINLTQNVNLTADIAHNYMNFPNAITNSIGININHFSGSSRWRNVNVFDNHIRNHGIGINLLNTNGIAIDQNIIKMNQDIGFNQTGIKVVNSRYTYVNANNITGIAASVTPHLFYRRTGIYLSNSPYNALVCNDMDYTTEGMRIAGNNLTVNSQSVSGNQFHHHYYGMYLERLGGIDAKIGDIGTSTHSNGNLFKHSPSNESYTSGWQTYTFANQSSSGKIFYLTSHGGDLNRGVPSNLNRLTPVNIDATVLAEFDCETRTGTSTRNPGILQFVLDVATGAAFSNISTTYMPIVQYEYRKLALALIDTFPDLIDSSNAIYSFQKSYLFQIETKMNQMYSHLYHLSDTTIVYDSVAYQTALSNAITFNNNLITSSNYDYNEKMVIAAYLQTIASGNYLHTDTPHLNFITWLAHQCPFTEGNAVYLARGLYALINPVEEYVDEALCPTYNLRMLTIEKDEEFEYNPEKTDEGATSIYLRPNPAKDYTTIFYNIPLEQQAILIIYDQLGRIVLNEKLTGGTGNYNICTTKFRNGIYIYRFMVDNKDLKRDKFVVVK